MTAPPRISYVMRHSDGIEKRFGPVGTYNKDLPNVKRIVEKADVDGLPSSVVPVYSWSADGSHFAITDNKSSATVYNSDSNKVVCRIERKIATVALSPRGTFLLTWEKYDKSTNKENLLVWETATGKEVGRFFERSWSRETWPPLRWTEDEATAARSTTNQIQMFPGLPFDQSADVTTKIHLKGVTTFALSPVTSARDRESGAPAFKIAAFVPEKKGNPASVSIYAFPTQKGSRDCGDPVSNKGFFNAQEAILSWAPSGKAVLVRTHTEQGSGKDSYYGKTGLHLIMAQGTGGCMLPSPAHSAAWNPDPEADTFVTICMF